MGGMPFPGIGIVFDIDALGGGYYGYGAWKIFMKYVRPEMIRNTILMEGDTRATLAGAANEFCIAVYGSLLDPACIREIFAGAQEKGLAPKERMFILKPRIDVEPLPIRGRIDGAGYFVTDEWMRIDHDLCKGAGWKYRPGKIPGDLPEDLRAELEKLMR